MKITIEPYSGGTFTAQTDAEHIDEVIKLFKGLLVSCGYHPKTVDEHLFDEENGQWYSDAEEQAYIKSVDATISRNTAHDPHEIANQTI